MFGGCLDYKYMIYYSSFQVLFSRLKKKVFILKEMCTHTVQLLNIKNVYIFLFQALHKGCY